MSHGHGDSCGRTPRSGCARRWVGLLLVCALLAGCGTGLNPSFMASLGISPINSLGPQPGSILLLLINQTAFTAQARVRLFEEAGYQVLSRLDATANEYFVTGIDCDVSQIAIESATVRVVDPTSGATSDEDLEVPTTPLVGGVNYVCGRIIVITISGTTNNFQLTTRVE